MNAIHSMTAFGRATLTADNLTIAWEVKTLNNRYLELHFKLPDAAKPFEQQLRDRAKAQLNRGKLETFVKVTTATSDATLINQTKLAALTTQLDQINTHYPGAGIPTTLEILHTPGILEQNQSIDIESPLTECFAQALAELNAARAREGEQLKQLILQRVDDIEAKSHELEAHMPALQQKQHQRLVDKLTELSENINHERLEQELVILANKSDVAEELDRLRTHCHEIRRILEAGGACGRRLDFMMQELNREANTLGSKAVGTDVTQTAVDIKVLIEQMREQIQNIE